MFTLFPRMSERSEKRSCYVPKVAQEGAHPNNFKKITHGHFFRSRHPPSPKDLFIYKIQKWIPTSYYNEILSWLTYFMTIRSNDVHFDKTIYWEAFFFRCPNFRFRAISFATSEKYLQSCDLSIRAGNYSRLTMYVTEIEYYFLIHKGY